MALRNPDDHIARDLKPAFPEWLRRRFPMLRAEDSNALFIAFRRRRKLYAPSAWTVMKYNFDPRIFAVIGVIFLFVAGFIALTIFVPATRRAASLAGALVWPVIITVSVLGVVTRNARKKKTEKAFLPIRVGGVFSPDGYQHQAALDVWMSGFTGRDVAEAIFLENYERAWKWLIWGPPLLAMVVSLPYVISQWPHTKAQSLALCTLIAPVVALSRLTFVSMFDVAGTRALERRYAFWRNRSAIAGALSEMGRQMVENLVPGLVAAGVMVGFFVLGGFSIRGVFWIRDYMSWTDVVRQNLTSINVVIVALYLTGMLETLRFLAKRLYIPRCEKSINSAEFPFAALMAGVVCEDPDGEAWARWRYGKLSPGQAAAAQTKAPPRMS